MNVKPISAKLSNYLKTSSGIIYRMLIFRADCICSYFRNIKKFLNWYILRFNIDFSGHLVGAQFFDFAHFLHFFNLKKKWNLN